MADGTAGRRIQSVLFMCALNAVRSPMAEGIARHYFGRSLYVASAGVRPDEIDPFTVAVMDEIGIDLAGHRPQSLEELEDTGFDLIVTLSPEAHHRAMELTRTMAAAVEYWPTFDPTAVQGSRDQRLDAYRSVRDGLRKRIVERFSSQK
ncbi:protein-tyrosine-phosphatase [Pseudochelatococcus lubricantis]|uniref:Protein-tyrosine-phosphatase n=1 Tax=Pseudochelatococcus lubricantis TaxID=1538102 RepID=A0ABX0V337_9HYPH|nr:arsenate reductase ArsC [Pseudochelatococcus lubricantis]NIJ59627.1 protein-tyrosine-phosphatase [Pseudochelatococcus lubricantis]